MSLEGVFKEKRNFENLLIIVFMFFLLVHWIICCVPPMIFEGPGASKDRAHDLKMV